MAEFQLRKVHANADSAPSPKRHIAIFHLLARLLPPRRIECFWVAPDVSQTVHRVRWDAHDRAFRYEAVVDESATYWHGSWESLAYW